MLNYASTLPTITRSRSFHWLAGIWGVSTVVSGIVSASDGFLSLGGAVFAGFLVWLTIRLVRIPNYLANLDDVLRPTGTPVQKMFQTAVIAITFLWILIYGWAYGSLFPHSRWMHLPHLSKFVWNVYFAPRPHERMIAPAFAFVSLVVIPGILLLLAGRTRRSLGLVRPVAGVGWATLSCISIALLFAISNFIRGKVTLTSFSLRLLHNIFNNGFTEEFFARGMILSQLRGRLNDGWAIALQALLFAAGHFGSTLAEPHSRGHVTLALANSIALNAPVGFALGIMALRGRSLLQGTIVHVFLDTMTG